MGKHNTNMGATGSCCRYADSVCGGCPAGCFCRGPNTSNDKPGLEQCQGSPHNAGCDCYLRNYAIFSGVTMAVWVLLLLLGIGLYVRARKQAANALPGTQSPYSTSGIAGFAAFFAPGAVIFAVMTGLWSSYSNEEFSGSSAGPANCPYDTDGLAHLGALFYMIVAGVASLVAGGVGACVMCCCGLACGSNVAGEQPAVAVMSPAGDTAVAGMPASHYTKL